MEYEQTADNTLHAMVRLRSSGLPNHVRTRVTGLLFTLRCYMSAYVIIIVSKRNMNGGTCMTTPIDENDVIITSSREAASRFQLVIMQPVQTRN